MTAGADVVGIGPAAPYQAARLKSSGRVPFPLFLDPDRAAYEALAVGRQPLFRYIFNLAAWMRWVRGFLRTRRQYRITGRYSVLPAVAVVDAAASPMWVHRGTGIADYPPVAEVLRRVRAATGTAEPEEPLV